MKLGIRDRKLLYMLNNNAHKFLDQLIHSRWRPLSYRNQSIDLQSKSMDWFLYGNGLCLERVKFNSIC